MFSVNNEIAITLSVNASLYGPTDEPILGGLLMIHNVGASPALKSGSAFLVEAGKISEVWVQYSQLIYLNGTTTSSYSGTISQVGLYVPSPNSLLAQTIDVDFVYTDVGVYKSVQYYVYTPDNWIGEVGGFACLFMFLYWAVLYLTMCVVDRVKPPTNTFAQMET